MMLWDVVLQYLSVSITLKVEFLACFVLIFTGRSGWLSEPVQVFDKILSWYGLLIFGEDVKLYELNHSSVWLGSILVRAMDW